MNRSYLPTAILVPSLNRPHRLRTLIANIHTATPEPHKILFCVSDDESKRTLDLMGEWYLDDSACDDKRYVTRMNKLAKEARAQGYPTIYFGQDDVQFHDGWLKEAVRVMDSRGCAVVVTNDLHNRNGTAALMRTDYMGRAVFDAPGDVFHEGYHHQYADNEQFLTADRQGELAYAWDAVVEHLHPAFGGRKAQPWDDTYEQAGSRWGADAALFEQRSQLMRS